MRKIFVTGCAGFIGNRVTQRLLEENREVVGIDNMNDYYDPALKEWRLAALTKHRNFSFKKKDISDLDAMDKLFNENPPEIVINLAARAGVKTSLTDPWIYYEANVKGALNILELCRKYGIKKFVISSSSSVYGLNKIPFTEKDETSRPLTPYGATKKGAEVLGYAYHYLYGMNIINLRYFTVYGPAGRPDMSIFIFIRNILEGKPIKVYGDGRQKRDFTYVDDIVEGTIKASGLSGYHIINLGGDNPVELIYVIRLIEQYLGKKAKIDFLPQHAADIPATWADISQAKTLLNWQPKVKIEEGIKRAVEWFMNNRDLVKKLKDHEEGNNV